MTRDEAKAKFDAAVERARQTYERRLQAIAAEENDPEPVRQKRLERENKKQEQRQRRIEYARDQAIIEAKIEAMRPEALKLFRSGLSEGDIAKKFDLPVDTFQNCGRVVWTAINDSYIDETVKLPTPIDQISRSAFPLVMSLYPALKVADPRFSAIQKLAIFEEILAKGLDLFRIRDELMDDRLGADDLIRWAEKHNVTLRYAP